MAPEPATQIKHSNACNIFVVLTIISPIVLVLMFLPLDDETLGLLQFYNNLICVIFLIDFTLNLRATPKKSDYFIKERGWLDLLGSIPSLWVAFSYSRNLRLARLSRQARILRILRGENKEALVTDVVEHRSQYTGLITILRRRNERRRIMSTQPENLSEQPDYYEEGSTSGWGLFAGMMVFRRQHVFIFNHVRRLGCPKPASIHRLRFNC